MNKRAQSSASIIIFSDTLDVNTWFIEKEASWSKVI